MTDTKDLNYDEKEAYEAYQDRLSAEPCIDLLTDEEIEQMEEEGRI